MAKTSKPAKPPANASPTRARAIAAIVWTLLFASWAIIFLSLVSYSPKDPPTSLVYPPNTIIANWIGHFGALVSHSLYQNLGPGVWVLLIAWMVYMVAILRQKPITQPILRGIGVVMMAVISSAIIGLLFASTGSIDRPAVVGGLLSLFINDQLMGKFGFLGTLIIHASGFWIGAIITLDEFVLWIPRKALDIAMKAPAFFSRFTPNPVLVGKLSLPWNKKPALATADAQETQDEDNDQDNLNPADAIQMEARAVDPNIGTVVSSGPATITFISSDTPDSTTLVSDSSLPTIVSDSSTIDTSAPAPAAPVAPAASAPQAKPAVEPVNPRAQLMQAPAPMISTSLVATPAPAFVDSTLNANPPRPIAAVATNPQGEIEVDDAVEPSAPAAYIEEKSSTGMPDEIKEKIRALQINMAPLPKPAPIALPVEKDLSGYKFPGIDLLEEPESNFNAEMEGYIRDQAVLLESALQQYRIDGTVVGIDSGPVITLYEIRLAAGTKVNSLSSVASDLARALKAINIRIVPNMVGKDTVGIEVPNHKKEKVRLKELIQSYQARNEKMMLPMFLGKDASGNPMIEDLAKMPHMLIAGTTGSGKSVCMNSIIMSFILTKRPDELKLVLVDPKMVEMSQFRDIPHLMCPVVTEMSKATAILEWAVQKMDERYELLAGCGVRDIASYNSLGWDEIKERMNPTSELEEAKIPKKLYYMVFVIDELADLMMTNKEVEGHIVRIAQKARAVGMHLILATQRPQANVVTGLIKGNMPARISMKVASGLDSRIVLDQKGAELLLGHGDMLFLSPRHSKLSRAQGTLVDDLEIRRCVKFVKDVSGPSFEPSLVQIKTAPKGEASDGNRTDGFSEHEEVADRDRNADLVSPDGVRDELFEDAVNVVLETKRGSVSLLQRRLTIGYGRASRLIEEMAQAGILGDYKGSQAREVNISLEEWEAMREQIQRERASGSNGAMAQNPDTLYYEKQEDQDSSDVPDEMPGEHRN
jgi:DNA segregation ATPase FtsK/SpoIIIE-like protein